MRPGPGSAVDVDRAAQRLDSVGQAGRASASAGSGCSLLVPTPSTPHRRPSTMIGVPIDERTPCSRASATSEPEAPGAQRAATLPSSRNQRAAAGNLTSTLVPRPGGLVSFSVPPSASARSRRPVSPEPPGSAPPTPSSRTDR